MSFAIDLYLELARERHVGALEDVFELDVLERREVLLIRRLEVVLLEQPLAVQLVLLRGPQAVVQLQQRPSPSPSPTVSTHDLITHSSSEKPEPTKHASLFSRAAGEFRRRRHQRPVRVYV